MYEERVRKAVAEAKYDPEFATMKRVEIQKQAVYMLAAIADELRELRKEIKKR